MYLGVHWRGYVRKNERTKEHRGDVQIAGKELNPTFALCNAT